MAIPKLLVAKFHQLNLSRDFAQADRTLKDIRGKLSNARWNQGYIFAMEGMLTANRGKNDRYALISQLQSEKGDMVDFMEEFRQRSRDLICSEFDRGFFTAWADFTHYLVRKEGMASKKPRPPEKQAEEMNVQLTVKEKVETAVGVKEEESGESVRQLTLNLHGALEEGEEEYPEGKPGHEEGKETGKPDVSLFRELQGRDAEEESSNQEG
jgi:hypothetical protein